MLTSLAVGLKLLEETPDQNRMRAHAAELRELAASTIRAVHTLAFELRPSVLDDLGLVAAVGRIVAPLSSAAWTLPSRSRHGGYAAGSGA